MEARQVLVLGLWLFEHVFHRSGGGRVVRSYMCGYGVAVDTGRLGDNANVTVLLKSYTLVEGVAGVAGFAGFAGFVRLCSDVLFFPPLRCILVIVTEL